MNAFVLPGVAKFAHRRYGSPCHIADNGFGHPNISRRISATVPKAGAFFMPATSFYGGCARGAFERAGFLESRLTNLRTAATHSFGHERGGSSILGAVPMKHARNPSSSTNSRAAAFKAMAFAALYANSSLSCRLKRYNAAMAKARSLEAQELAQ